MRTSRGKSLMVSHWQFSLNNLGQYNLKLTLLNVSEELQEHKIDGLTHLILAQEFYSKRQVILTCSLTLARLGHVKYSYLIISTEKRPSFPLKKSNKICDIAEYHYNTAYIISAYQLISRAYREHTNCKKNAVKKDISE